MFHICSSSKLLKRNVLFRRMKPFFFSRLSVCFHRRSSLQSFHKGCFSGFSNTATRFVSGWITKIPYMSPLMVNNIGLIISGVVTLLVPLCTTHGLLITYCIICGAFIGNQSSFHCFLHSKSFVFLSKLFMCH